MIFGLVGVRLMAQDRNIYDFQEFGFPAIPVLAFALRKLLGQTITDGRIQPPNWPSALYSLPATHLPDVFRELAKQTMRFAYGIDMRRTRLPMRRMKPGSASASIIRELLNRPPWDPGQQKPSPSHRWHRLARVSEGKRGKSSDE